MGKNKDIIFGKNKQIKLRKLKRPKIFFLREKENRKTDKEGTTMIK